MVRSRGLGYAMPLHLERINWMPSPPLVPDDGPIDFAHLKRMTLGDGGLEREVLAMFAGQAVRLIEALAGLPADAAELAHTLNGSARAIGAFRVADAAESFEASPSSEALAALKQAAEETVAFLQREQGLSAADAYSLASIAVDYVVGEAVDQVQMVYGSIPKRIFTR